MTTPPTMVESDMRQVPWTPTEAMWGGLARAIMMWLDMPVRRTPESLLLHLDRTAGGIPQWLRDEPEMQHLDHSMSKGTRCVLVYRAMLHDHAISEGEGK